MIRAPLKLTLLLMWIGLWIAPVWVAKKLHKLTLRDHCVRLCYIGMLRIVGIRLKVSGKLSQTRPLLLVTNHLSYLDVMVLGAAAPVRFTPKSEVGKWPVIGMICRLCDAVFIDRRTDKIKDMRADLQKSLSDGNVICLFPEGTTDDGRHLLPFKSSFFSLLEEPLQGREVMVQPAAIAYTHIRRLPIDSTQWPDIAWYGDMSLVPHLFRLLRLGTINAELIFLPPAAPHEFTDRKQVAAHCHHLINEAIHDTRDRPPVKAKHIEIKQFIVILARRILRKD